MKNPGARAAAAFAMLLAAGCGKPKPAPPEGARTRGPLLHRIYIWQRLWTPAVKDAVAKHGGEFAGLAPLGAQLSWPRGGPMTAVRPDIDWKSLASAGRPVTPVIRLEKPLPDESAQIAEAVKAEAQRLMADAAGAGVTLEEMQLDYDAPQRKLAAYAAWLARVERVLDPLPVRITTLASWLGEPEFVRLIAACDGYVLQVHSFDPPGPGETPTVCDPVKARRWVGQAAKLGRPFTVALPTYRTTAGYDPQGKLVGIATDAAVPDWPAGTVRREFPSDPGALAALIAEWMHDRPAMLSGVHWYRMPVATDVRNWRWPALSAVMAGRAPLSKLEVNLTGGAPLDAVLSNPGEQDEWLPDTVTLNWSGPPPAAGDAVSGWRLSMSAGSAVFTSTATTVWLIPAGTTAALGWLRFHEPAPSSSEIRTMLSPPAPAAPRDR